MDNYFINSILFDSFNEFIENMFINELEHRLLDKYKVI
jgi:hypothetical protein